MKPVTKKPAHKEPWFWMVLGPLLVVMVVSITMAFVAFRVADDRVKDDYYKEGRMINKRFAEEETAIALAVRGEVQFDFTTGEVWVDLQAKRLPSQLLLMFSHPSDAGKDETLTLRKISSNRYRGDLSRRFEGRWYLIVGTSESVEADNWRVTTELDFNSRHSAHFSAHL